MLNFITMILVLNLLFFMLIYLIRHFIPLNIRVLVITGIVSILSAVLFPYMSAHLPYPLVIEVFLCFILICAITLALVDNKISSAQNTENNMEKETLNEIITEPDLKTTTEQTAIASTVAETVQEEIIVDTALREQVTTETTDTSAHKDQPAQQILDTTTFTQTDKDQMFSTPDESLPEQTVSPTQAPLSLLKLNAQETTTAIALCKLTDSTTDTETNIEANIEIIAREKLKPKRHIQEINKSDDEQHDLAGSQILEPDAKTNAQELLPQKDKEVHTRSEKLQQLITGGFSAKKAGYYEQAIKNFYVALQLEPAPKLAVLIMLEISEIYTLIDQSWQAAEILKVLLVKWQHELDNVTTKEVKNKISILQNAA